MEKLVVKLGHSVETKWFFLKKMEFVFLQETRKSFKIGN